MLKIISAIFLVLHGITHTILALVPSSKDPDPQFAMFYPGLGSWLLSKFELSLGSLKTTAITLSAIATIGFIATGLAMLDIMVPFNWWRILEITSAVISMILLLAFWNKVLIVGVIIDVAVLVILIFTKWSPV